MYKGIIFDLDGTLLDTLEDLALSVNRILMKMKLPTHTTDSYRFFVGEGIDEMVRRAFPSEFGGSERLPMLVSEVKEEYARCWAEHTKPYPGVPELLDFLERKGFPKAIFSNKPQEFASLTVQNLLSDWSFLKVRGIKPGSPRKPDPREALLIAEEMKLAPKDIIFLGDTMTDIKTALNGGFFPVGAAWGFRPVKELEDAGALFIANCPDEIKTLFGGINE